MNIEGSAGANQITSEHQSLKSHKIQQKRDVEGKNSNITSN